MDSGRIHYDMIDLTFSPKSRFIHLLAGILFLTASACSPRPPADNRQADFHGGLYHHAFLNRALIDMLYQVRSDIMASANVRADFQIISNPNPNAFLTVIENEPTVILTTGILELIGNAKDEYAFLIAHECAHLSRNHLKDRKEAQDSINTAGSAIITGIEFLGMAVGLPLGLFSVASVESGSHLAALKYDRDQEREADRYAVAYMTAAGYDPHGAISFHEKMMALAKGPAIAILSTHPPDKERLETIRALIDNHNPATATEPEK